MIIRLKDNRGYTAKLSIYEDRVDYEVSHTTIKYREKRSEDVTSGVDNYTIVSWLVRGLLNEGFTIKSIK